MIYVLLTLISLTLRYQHGSASVNINSISIAAWNICGIKSKLEDPDFIQELLPHDIIILSETFTENNNLHIPGYKCKNIFRKLKHKKARKNSGGVSVLTKINIANFVTPVKTTAESLIWLKISKNLTGYPSDTFCCCAYIPPYKSPYYKTYPNLDLFDSLSSEITQFSKLGHILITGDLNSRLGSKSDILLETEANTPGDNFTFNSGLIKPPPRCFLDDKSNTWGGKLIDICVAHNMCVLNGRTVGDFEGKFTFFERGFSTIDLSVVDSHILSNTLGFKVHSFLPYYSSHCKIETILACSPIKLSSHDPTIQTMNFDKFIWNKTSSEEKLSAALSSPVFSALREKILNTNYTLNASGTDALCGDVDNISKFLHGQCCDKVRIGNKSHSKAKRKKWFSQCFGN